MGAPDPARVYIKEGRYNHTGQSILYLSSSKSTALHEVMTKNENLCAIQKYKVRRLDNILDLRAEYGDINPDLSIIHLAIVYNGFTGDRPTGNSCWKPEYFVPRFVADIARYSKCQGILYNSAVGPGENLVVFRPKCKGLRRIGPTCLYREKT